MLFNLQPMTTENIIGAAVGVVAIITMIFLILGFKESRKSAEAAQRSAEIAQQTADLAISESKSRNRPWLMLDGCSIISPIYPQRVSLDFRFKNIGAMPARNVVLSLEIEVSRKDLEKLEEGVEQWIADTWEPSGQPLSWETIFPNQVFEYSADCPLEVWRANNLHPFITGFINYHGESHITGFEGKISPSSNEIQWQNTTAT